MLVVWCFYDWRNLEEARMEEQNVIFVESMLVMVGEGEPERFKMEFYRAEKFADKNMFRCVCRLFLGDVVVGEIEGEDVDSFGAVYLAIWHVKQALRAWETERGYRYYYEGSGDGEVGQERDLDVSFGFYL